MDKRPNIPMKPKGQKFKFARKEDVRESEERNIKKRKNFGNKFLSKIPAFSSGKTVKIDEATIED